MAAPSSQDMILGELRGQVRELVHSVNNLSAKFDGLSREVSAIAALAVEVAELRIKVAALIAEQHRVEGARGLGSMLLKSPALGWLVGGLTAAWALLTGKVNL